MIESTEDARIGELTGRMNELRRQVAGIEGALATARGIGIALGILMANDKITQDQAFGQLVTASQFRNRKLHLIAAEVAETGCLKPS